MLKFIPLALFAVLVVFLGKGLKLDPHELNSPLIDKPAPSFSLPTLFQDGAEFDSSSMLGQVWILNVWASWCSACVIEHPNFVALAKEHDVALVGLNYKDTPEAAGAWLQRFGNPFSIVLDDRAGGVGIDWGVYGVPETFVMDKQGKVRHKFIGPVDQEKMRDVLLPLLEQLQSA